MADLIERDKVLHEIDQLSHAWEYGNAVDDCYEIVKKAPTVDAIPVEWIKQFIKKENIDIIHKVGIIHMVEQWKLHPIDFAIHSEPQWIPVSKKLPNKNDYVIVTTKCGVVIEAQFEVWNSGEKEWWIDNDNSLEFDDVVAWMPMPKPYERKEE